MSADGCEGGIQRQQGAADVYEGGQQGGVVGYEGGIQGQQGVVEVYEGVVMQK